MNFKSLYKEYKENHLFWLMFVLFFFLWFVSTVIFTAFCKKYGVYGTEGSIGAYANILVFDATIFAPIAAYFFIDNWKEQKNLTFFSIEAKELWLKLQKTEDYSYKIDRIINKYVIINYSQFEQFDHFFELLTDTLNEVHYFIELTGDELLGKSNDHYISFQNKYEEQLNLDLFENNIDEEMRNNLIEINQKIRQILKKYIIIK